MKEVRVRSALPIYCAAAVWPLAGAIWPGAMLRVGPLCAVAMVSAAAYAVGSKLFPGKTVQVRERTNTGDAQIDRQIDESRVRLERLRDYDERLPDPEISRHLGRMRMAGEAILDALAKDPARAPVVRRFMSYYLPAAEKIVARYVELSASPVKGDNIRSAMASVERSLDMIADAFEKQLDSLYRDTSFDLEADMRVMETMLRSEGLAGDGLSTNQQAGKTRAGV